MCASMYVCRCVHAHSCVCVCMQEPRINLETVDQLAVVSSFNYMDLEDQTQVIRLMTSCLTWRAITLALHWHLENSLTISYMHRCTWIISTPPLQLLPHPCPQHFSLQTSRPLSVDHWDFWHAFFSPKILFDFDYLYKHESLCGYVHMSAGPAEARRGHWIPWSGVTAFLSHLK